ncbi:methylamine utilization protein MauE [Planomonospora sp. ID91781]|uniref:Methylamine utilization protein MauE n=1 Tax=Planomonospora sphaerica TaxID=161355 RepID=A0A161LJY0_9ACTN|nr:MULTISPECIES: MauE/DoxX family redox-associated membrane protein [Planomonospora]MBG0821546.1 methylamine utilization protein MauE [Planomonospora sp. ID91781]GAT66875.1 methylamine utilization protein MauE [Planomonospora sphaerica]
MTYLTIACGVLLALVFTASAWSKLRSRTDLASFTESLRRLRPLPPGWTAAAAAAVVSAEALIPVLVAFPAVRPAGYGLAAGLLAVLSVAIELSVRRGDAVPCRCFGPSPSPLGRRHLVRNGLLLAAAVAGGAGSRAADLPPVHPAGAAVAVAAAGLAAAAVIRFDDIAELFAGPSRPRTR